MKSTQVYYKITQSEDWWHLIQPDDGPATIEHTWNCTEAEKAVLAAPPTALKMGWPKLRLKLQ
jgi:hypothetical protein